MSSAPFVLKIRDKESLRSSPFPKPQIEDPDGHVKWEYHDFVGKYHLRKIKSEFPIPGLTVTRKQKSNAANKKLNEDLQNWREATRKAKMGGVLSRTAAESDFLRMSDTGRASERVINALAPSIALRAEAFHKFKNRRNPNKKPFVRPNYEEDDLDIDYRLVQPNRDFRFNIMPKQRMREIQHLTKKRNEFPAKKVDVLTTDQLITAVSKRRGPPPAVRDTKTRQLSRKYHHGSRFSTARLKRRQQLEDQRRGLASAATSLSDSSSCSASLQSRPSTVSVNATDLAGLYDSRPSTVSTREFRRRNRFL